MKLQKLTIDTSDISFNDIKTFIEDLPLIELSAEAEKKVSECRIYLNNKMAQTNQLIYGVNTGFGFLQNVQIAPQQIEQLQYNLLMSHACGMGNLVPQAIIRLMLLLKIKSLSFGNSGVQTATIQALISLYNNNVLPVIYTQGSLGASGDLAPLSHLSLPIIGMGEVYYNNEICKTADVLQKVSLTTVSLQSKEGLALINGTQFMSAYGMYCLYKSEKLLQWANFIAAISFDAFDCVSEPLHPLIHLVRKHKGQIKVAQDLKNILAGSIITTTPKQQVQDPYSFRCIPQVHGASFDVFENILNVFLDEINAVTDNPNIFPEEDLVVSGGNFHGQPLALRLDFLAIAMSEIANISERRTYQLISGQRGLPLFLVKDPGLHSGFMIPQYTAAGIVSENKQLCTPASVDSISSSNNQEDHVSMGANAATKCFRVIENVERVLAIELLTAAQAMDFRRPATSSSKIEQVLTDFRKQVSFNTEDRVLHNDMQAAVNFLQDYNLPIA